MTIDLKKILALAEEAALQAGKLLKKQLHSPLQVNFQSIRDIKLQVDIQAEECIRAILSEKSTYPIIGEEQGGNGEILNTDEYFWVVDPLDGTYNYYRSFPISCVSIGLMRGKSFISGVIYDFNCDVMLSGIVPEKLLRINQKTVETKPAWETAIDRACLMTGFPSGFNYETNIIRNMVEQTQRFSKIRMIGSAAMALAYIAQGYADAYYEENIRLWDIAGGAALVLAAGGHIEYTIHSLENLKCSVLAVPSSEWLQYFKEQVNSSC